MAKTKRIYKKHFIVFNNNGIISATTPKDWARANQDYFPKYDFSDSYNTPIVEEIEKYLLILELDDFMLSNTSANLLNKGNLITFLIQKVAVDFIW